MSKQTVEIELGGQEFLIHCNVTGGNPATRWDPPNDPEMEITKAELVVRLVEGGRQRVEKIDLTDLIDELTCEDWEHIEEKVWEALEDQAAADAESRAEAIAEERALRRSES